MVLPPFAFFADLGCPFHCELDGIAVLPQDRHLSA